MHTASQYLDDLTEAVALKADGHLVAMLTQKVRVEISRKDQEIDRLVHEVERLKELQH